MAELVLPDFLIVPTGVLHNPSLRTLDGLVYGAIYWFKKLKNERCTASNKVIGSIVKCNSHTVSLSLTRLSRAGVIEVRINKETNNREEIIPLVAFNTIDPSSNETGGSPNELGGVAQMVKGGGSNEPQNKNIEKEKGNKMSQPSQNDSHGEEQPFPAAHDKSYSNMDWLTSLSKDDIVYFQNRFSNLPESLITKEALRAHDWLFDKQLVRKDYRAFLRNWLEKTSQNWGTNKNEKKERVIWG